MLAYFSRKMIGGIAVRIRKGLIPEGKVWILWGRSLTKPQEGWRLNLPSKVWCAQVEPSKEVDLIQLFSPKSWNIQNDPPFLVAYMGMINDLLGASKIKETTPGICYAMLGPTLLGHRYHAMSSIAGLMWGRCFWSFRKWLGMGVRKVVGRFFGFNHDRDCTTFFHEIPQLKLRQSA